MPSAHVPVGRLFYVEVTGYREAAGRFAKASEALSRSRREEMRELGRKIVTALREEAPVRTGELARKIGFKTFDHGQDVELSVTSGAPHTVYVIRGRGPVVAKKAFALRFEPGPPGSGFIFRRRVGPAKANPFHRRAMGRLGDEPAATAGRIARQVVRAYSAH